MLNKMDIKYNKKDMEMALVQGISIGIVLGILIATLIRVLS